MVSEVLPSRDWIGIVTTPWIAAREIRAGDVVVFGPGDTRHVAAVEPLDDGRLVHLDFGDGRLSLLDAWKPVVRLHPPAPPALPSPALPTAPPTSPTSPTQTGAPE